MKTQKRINIIGGGIAGLTTALALQNKGIDFRLFEKSGQISYENVGFGISANIFPILEELNILSETENLGAKIKHFHFVDEKLKYIKSFPINQPALSVNRKEFHQLFLNQLPTDKIFLNTEKLTSDFDDSEIVISADGINSQTRKKWYPNLNTRNSNQILWRGITKIQLGEKFQNSYHNFIGNNLRFAIIDTGNSFYSWYIIKQKDNTTIKPENYTKEELIYLFQNYHPIVKETIQKSDNIYFSELKDISPAQRKKTNWYKGNALLIGDAIHPTTPNMANGGCLAIEDAYLLAEMLEYDSVDFQKFQNLRTKKVNAVVRQSWLFGQLSHQKNIVMDKIIKLVFAMTPKFIFDKVYSTVLTKTPN
jgi:salicylate hydroxylase